jgi:small subunit ribosomal protein S9
LLAELRSEVQKRRSLNVAKKTEVPEAAEAPEEKEEIEEAPEAAEETEDVEVPEAAEATEPTEEPAAEATAEEEVAEATEPVEAPQAEAIDVAEESTVVEEEVTEAAAPAELVEEVTEAAEPAEPVEFVTELAELVEDLPETADLYYYGTGRRKTSTAQVRLYPSKEPEIIVNDKEADHYFSRTSDLMNLQQPLRVTATDNLFRITVKVRGGGISGQAGAVRHGIARALTKANPEFRLALRKRGFLTRDPRMKERKKPGLKRARKAPQYTKR